MSAPPRLSPHRPPIPCPLLVGVQVARMVSPCSSLPAPGSVDQHDHFATSFCSRSLTPLTSIFTYLRSVPPSPTLLHRYISSAARNTDHRHPPQAHSPPQMSRRATWGGKERRPARFGAPSHVRTASWSSVDSVELVAGPSEVRTGRGGRDHSFCDSR